MRTGTSLAELSVVLLLIAALSGSVWPPLRMHLDAWAAGAAADAFAGAIARTRSVAITHGGAALAVDPPVLRIETAGGTAIDSLVLERVEVVLDATPPVRIAYDALGLGRLANRTIRFRSGAVERVVTVSAYGRVRRW